MSSRHPQASQQRLRICNLSNDLASLQMAFKPELSGRAEGAAQGAACLARNAQSCPTRIAHQHRLIGRSIRGPEKPLPCLGVVRHPFLFYLEGPEIGRQPSPQLFREVGHGGGLENRMVIEPFPELVEAIGGFALK